MRATRIAPLLLVITWLTACGSDPLDVDTSSVTIDPVKVQRLDEKFFLLDSSDPVQGMSDMRKEFGVMPDCYLNNIICFASPDSVDCYNALTDFIHSYDMRGVWEACTTKFTDGFGFLEEDVTGAYTYFKAHFPDRELPKGVFITMNGFHYNYFSCSGYYGIGMEFFLGKDNLYYDALEWPMYKRRTLSQEYMSAGFVRSWMMNEFPFTSEKNDVINRIVYEGQIMYLQHALLRNAPDSIITGYTQAQLDWCEVNEADMWAKMIENSTVYSENEEDLNHMTVDAPFTPGFPRESPGRAGCWIGYRIVQAYMELFPETTLEELMAMNDGQTLLTQSKYKPTFE